eukprot:PLAT13297.1.p1 GENE.PLAT13297.1~~PLAT13297.1.p1  ORF type:complete len:185 (+),score=79.27 PLAT13297.1:14-568(+)
MAGELPLHPDGFSMPDMWDFPPFFTLQPVDASREKQVAMWVELILAWHGAAKLSTLTVADCPLWENKSIARKLAPDALMVILDAVVASGRGEWEDERKERMRVLYRTHSEWAALLFDWVREKGMVGSVYTVYELHSGEEYADAPFHGLEPDIMRAALDVLEERGQAQVFSGETSEEDGVKFFAE